MAKNVVLLNIGHLSSDDRVFFHQAQALAENSYNVTIISTMEDVIAKTDNINIHSFDGSKYSRKNKIIKASELIEQYQPDIIFCDNPVSVHIAAKYKKKKKNLQIIYDVTEWYPSKKNLRNISKPKKPIWFLILAFSNFYAGLKADKFIFGEYYKSVPFKIFFWKKKIELSYYPDLKYIKVYPIRNFNDEIRIFYSGVINKEKGFNNVINVVAGLAAKYSEQTIKLNIIGYFLNENEKNDFNNITSNLPENVKLSITPHLPFEEYCRVIGDNHFYFDLREKDFENNLCLPIKIFYYLACERPVFYSDFKAIRHKLNADSDFINLAEPTDVRSIISQISRYIDVFEFYEKSCREAGEIAKEKYNWEMIKQQFLDFIK